METYNCWKEGNPKVNIASWIEVTQFMLKLFPRIITTLILYKAKGTVNVPRKLVVSWNIHYSEQSHYSILQLSSQAYWKVAVASFWKAWTDTIPTLCLFHLMPYCQWWICTSKCLCEQWWNRSILMRPNKLKRNAYLCLCHSIRCFL